MIIQTPYSVIVWISSESKWHIQYPRGHSSHNNINDAYRLKETEEYGHSGRYTFRVVDRGTDLTKIAPPQ